MKSGAKTAAANGIGFSFAFCDSCDAVEVAPSGEACLAFPIRSSFLATTDCLAWSTFCLAWALTSARSASASTVSPIR